MMGIDHEGPSGIGSVLDNRSGHLVGGQDVSRHPETQHKTGERGAEPQGTGVGEDGNAQKTPPTSSAVYASLEEHRQPPQQEPSQRQMPSQEPPQPPQTRLKWRRQKKQDGALPELDVPCLRLMLASRTRNGGGGAEPGRRVGPHSTVSWRVCRRCPRTRGRLGSPRMGALERDREDGDERRLSTRACASLSAVRPTPV